MGASVCYAVVAAILFLATLQQQATFTSSYSINSLGLLKRSEGNPCPKAEKPFPCKSTKTCIPMGYLCDANPDCEDGYDEDPEVCTAAHRPPVEDIMNFLQAEKGWMMESLFDGKRIADVAHGLAVSQTVDDFRTRVGLSPQQESDLRKVLHAVKKGHEEVLEMLGMPPSSWNEVSFIFSKLIKSGFTA